jgi:plastocyanin
MIRPATRVSGAGAILAVALAIVGCGGSSSSSSSAHSTSSSAAPAQSSSASTGGSASAGSGGAATAPTSGKTVKVAIKNFAYSPASLSVKAGTKVTWTNDDSTAHTSTASGSALTFDTGTIKPGASGSVTLTKPGTYSYICTFHPFMKATITVAG